MTAVSGPAQDFSGEDADVTWTVTNAGAAVWDGTRHWTDRVWISADPTFPRDRATLLGGFTHANTGGLAAGASYTETRTVTLPRGIGGQFYLYVEADPLPPTYSFPESIRFYGGNVFEGEGAAERDNVGSGPIPVTYREPDLVVSALVVPAAPPTAGDPVTVTWTVTNRGDRATRNGAWGDGVWLARDPSIDPLRDTLLAVAAHAPVLAAGESYTQTVTVDLPYAIGGEYYLVVYADDPTSPYPLVHVDEFQGEGNNVTARPLTVLPNPLPDLRVAAVAAPQRAVASQSIAVTYTVINAGPAGPLPTQQAWSDEVYLSVDPFLDLAADFYLGGRRHVGGLAAGAQYTVSDTYRLPRSLAGAYYVFVVTDPSARGRGEVFEGSDANNSAASAQPVLTERPPPADLVVAAITGPSGAVTGRSVRVDWTVTNAGLYPAAGTWTDAVSLSADPVWDLGDRVVGRVEHSAAGLLPGQSYAAALDALLPAAKPGTYYVLVRGTDNPATLRADLLPFMVTNVTPD